MVVQTNIKRKSIIQDVGNSKSRTNKQREAAKAAIEEFHRDKSRNSNSSTYTDDSIHSRKREQQPPSLGFGASAATLIPLEEDKAVITSKPVGTMTDKIECEVAVIQIALGATADYITKPVYNKHSCDTYIMTDCIAAIDISSNQKNPGERSRVFQGNLERPSSSSLNLIRSTTQRISHGIVI